MKAEGYEVAYNLYRGYSQHLHLGRAQKRRFGTQNKNNFRVRVRSTSGKVTTDILEK